MPTPALPVWLREYRGEWLRFDLIAGLTLAAYLLPAGLADASLAGLPPEAGLYACLFSGLVFGFFCSPRHTVVTVTTARGIEFRLAEPNGWVRDASRRAGYGPFEDQTVNAAILSWRALRTA